MLRPSSIVTFERCYLGVWLIGLVNLALTWNARMEQANIAMARGGVATGGVSTIAIVGIVVGALITLTLWYFVARRGSVVAKWIVVVFFVLGLLGFLMSFMQGTFTGGIGGALTIVTWVLQAIAIAMLFRPDANEWFARRSGVVM